LSASTRVLLYSSIQRSPILVGRQLLMTSMTAVCKSRDGQTAEKKKPWAAPL